MNKEKRNTLKMERSALSMVYGHSIDITLPVRHGGDVKRSREDTANDKHISRSGKYADVFTVACSSGCRRCDMYSLRREYGKELYHTLTDDKSLRDSYLDYYPLRVEKVKSDFYKDRQVNVFERYAILICEEFSRLEFYMSRDMTDWILKTAF